MKLLLCRHLWGVEEKWEAYFPKVKGMGYEAIDSPFWDDGDDQRLDDLLQKSGLGFVGMIPTGGSTVKEHLKSYESTYKRLMALKPIHLYAHAGKDSFNEKEQDEFFSEALKIDPKVSFETHRGRILYNPWTTARLMSKFSKLRINADLSHWVVVTESLLDGQEDILKELAERTDHLHARVGYEEGPQVPDPRSKDYQTHVEAHERWWDMIWDSQVKRGMAVSTLTPEFGPPMYQHVNPLTGKPDVELSEICDWMAQRQLNRFKKRFDL